jgi:predicted nucleic acid-binding protein
MTFVDTSYLGALFMVHDEWHAAAVRWSTRVTTPLLTSDYILLEIADGLARVAWRGTADRIINSLKANPAVTIVAQSDALFEQGLQLYRSRQDKNWSLTDCLSFTIMKNYGCSSALTSDEHFTQAGFRALLRET